MARLDVDDELCIKFGGDGDNGETMLYLLDQHFGELDAEASELAAAQLRRHPLDYYRNCC